MNWFSTPKPDLAAALEGQRKMIDHIFGDGGYRIEAVDGDEAKLETNNLEACFVRDQRDGDIGCSIRPKRAIAELDEGSSSFMWAKFLGDEEEGRPRSRDGQVISSTEQQIIEELTTLERLVEEIFLDPQRTRDGGYWILGYNAGYTDSVSGSWD